MPTHQRRQTNLMTWRTGRHQPRNIYWDNQFIAVTVGCEEEAAHHAWSICYALNAIKEKPRMRRPQLGAIVYYKLSKYDVNRINTLRASRQHQSIEGNAVSAGQVYPAQIVRTFDTGDTGTVDDNTGTVNLQVNLDGDDTYWATSRQIGDAEGSYTTEA
jgi:hypothetical protein